MPTTSNALNGTVDRTAKPAPGGKSVFETTPEIEEARRQDATPDHVVLDIERHMPDGSAPTANERRVVPWVLAILGVAGLTVIVTIFTSISGWRAGLMAGAWVLLAYCVSWAAVWGAGLMRVKEEKQISDEVEEHLIDVPTQPPSERDSNITH